MWRSRAWRKLLNLIDHLPASSLFSEAVAQDDEAAREFLRYSRPSAPSTRVSEFSAEVMALAGIYDRIGSLIGIMAAANGGSASDLPTFPRPHVAAERVHVERAYERHRRLVAQLLPGVSDGISG